MKVEWTETPPRESGHYWAKVSSTWNGCHTYIDIIEWTACKDGSGYGFTIDSEGSNAYSTHKVGRPEGWMFSTTKVEFPEL